MKALGIAATGMQAQQTNVDVISNNIANANTTAYKSARAAFQDLIYETLEREGALTSEDGTTRPVGVDIGLGVQSSGVVRLTTQGGLTATENSLDIAIDGRGYFVINRPDGSVAYTRDGSFQLSPEGQLVTFDGFELDPGITVPEGTINVEISADGIVMAYSADEPAPVELGEISMAQFINETGLKPIGNNLFLETEASGEAETGRPGEDGLGILRQGYLENSNVNIIEQITQLITAQRAYEMNSKSIQTADQMMQTANQLK